MKISRLAPLFLLIALFSSCTSYRNKAEELTLPIIQGIQGDNYDKIKCLLTPKENVNELFAKNKSKLGWIYYNKYTESYRYQTLIANSRVDFDRIQDYSKQYGLDWSQVQLGEVTKQDVSDSMSDYSLLEAKLSFPKGLYVLKFDAAHIAGNWYLLHNIMIYPQVHP